MVTAFKKHVTQVKQHRLLALVGLLSFFSCLEPFNPSIPAEEINILVVEGYINAGPGITQIKLSRVSSLEKQTTNFAEEDAAVWIENEEGGKIQLTEKSQGIYESDSLTLPADMKYRLYIERHNGKTYSSEYQPVKITPPIDSVHWEYRDQLYIYASAHDDASLTTYYTWTFQEDWLIRSPYEANLIYSAGEIRPRHPSDMVKMLDCYGTNRSREILLASSRQLVNDAIQHEVATVTAASEKIQDRYRIIVYQRAMTEEEYNYMILVKKNSEQNGSFFDPMPSQLFGNIRNNVNPNEQVIGYIGAYTTEQSELNLYGYNLPRTPVQDKCESIDFAYTLENLVMYLSDATVYIPYKVYNLNGDPSKPRVIAMPTACMDCRVGASSVKPNPRWQW